MLTDKALKVLLREDIKEYPKISELYDILANETDENKRNAAFTWMSNESNKAALNAEIQKAIAANIIVNTFNIETAIAEISPEEKGEVVNNKEPNHIIIWPANPFLPGLGTKEAEAAEAIINKYGVASNKIFTYCPNNGETGMWGISSVSQFGHHKSCKSNILKGSQHNDDVITSCESLALTLLEGYSNSGNKQQAQVTESILREDEQLTNAKMSISWSEPIHVHCTPSVAKDFQGLAKILQDRGGTSKDATGNIISNIKVEIEEDLPDNPTLMKYAVQIYNDVCKYIDQGYKPGQKQQQNIEGAKEDTPQPGEKWSWDEVKSNKAAQQYISAVFADIKSCKDRVLQKVGPATKAKNLCKAVWDEYAKKWGTFFGAAFKSVAQLSGFGFVATVLQKGLEELNKEKENKKEDEFFKQFFNSKYASTLKSCAGEITEFIEWGE